jgi:hypothetical protein
LEGGVPIIWNSLPERFSGNFIWRNIMKLMNQMLIFMFVAASAHAGGGTVGSDGDMKTHLVVNPCPKAGDTFVLTENEVLLLNGFSSLKILNCSSEPDLLLLKTKSPGQSDDGQWVINQRVPKSSPEALMFQTGYGGRANLSTHQMQTSVITFFTHKPSSGVCQGKDEIGYVVANMNKAETQIEFKTILSEVCVNTPNVGPQPQVLNILDFNDKVDPNAPYFPSELLGVRFAYYISTPNGKFENIGVVDFNLKTGKSKLRAELQGVDYFPRGCGSYLYTVRLLEETNKLALFYASPRVVLVDFSKGSKRLTRSEVYNGDANNGMGRTCEGYFSTYNSLRSGDAGSTMVVMRPSERKFQFLNYSLKQGGFVITEIKY